MQLSRSGAYFVGEMIRCRAIISNRGTETGTLAGLFARLHCTRASNPKWVKKDSLVTFDKEHGAVAAVAKESDSLEMQSTEAFPWRAKDGLSDAQLLESSALHEIVRGLSLAPGAQEKALFSFRLASDVPTHSGLAIAYTYHIAVAAIVDEDVPVRLMVPVRVFYVRPEAFVASQAIEEEDISNMENPVQDWWTSSNGAAQITDEPLMETLQNARIQLRQRMRRGGEGGEGGGGGGVGVGGGPGGGGEGEGGDGRGVGALVDAIAYEAATESAAHGRSTYNIGSGHSRVCTFKLRKPYVRLGELFTGTFDFSRATVPCFRLCVSLVRTERLCDELLSGPSTPVNEAKCTVLEQHKVCANHRKCDFALVVPFEESQTFSTSLVSVQWSIRIDFVTQPLSDTTTSSSHTPTLGPTPPTATAPDSQALLFAAGPAPLAASLLSWTLPIVVLPMPPS